MYCSNLTWAWHSFSTKVFLLLQYVNIVTLMVFMETSWLKKKSPWFITQCWHMSQIIWCCEKYLLYQYITEFKWCTCGIFSQRDTHGSTNRVFDKINSCSKTYDIQVTDFGVSVDNNINQLVYKKLH